MWTSASRISVPVIPGCGTAFRVWRGHHPVLKSPHSQSLTPARPHRSASLKIRASIETPVKDYGIEMWHGKRLQTLVADVAPDTITIRSLDWDRDRFDIEFG